MTQPGWLVAGMGLPGCGKSTVFRDLGQLLGISDVFLEPEDSDWSEAVTNREEAGHFTGLTWFRASRVPQLFRAAAARDAGRRALIDSYYDKLLTLYLEKPGMDWVIAPGDPYYKLATAMTRLDYELLPDADAIVFFEVEERTWRRFLEARGREFDKHPGMLNSFPLQAYMLDAAVRYCSEKEKPLLVFKQQMSSPRVAAEKVAEMLQSKGLR